MSGVRAGRVVPWLVLAVSVAVVLTAAWPRGGHESVAAHTQRLTSELRCVDCEGLSVADSNTTSAAAIRSDVASRVRHGESDGTIRRHYVDLYGSSILLRPPDTGIGLVVWGLPVLALILAASGVVFALRRWSRQTRLDATSDDEALVAGARAVARDASTS